MDRDDVCLHDARQPRRPQEGFPRPLGSIDGDDESPTRVLFLPWGPLHRRHLLGCVKQRVSISSVPRPGFTRRGLTPLFSGAACPDDPSGARFPSHPDLFEGASRADRLSQRQQSPRGRQEPRRAMPIATKLDMNKDLQSLYTPPTYPVLVEVPQLRYVGCPSRGCSGPTGRTATLLAARYQGVGIDAGAPRAPGSACLSSPFRRPTAWSAWAGRRKRCKFLATPALHSPDGIAGWTWED